MLKYIIRRLLYLIPVIIGIIFIVFTIMYISPGDPARLILGERAPQAQVDQLRAEMGLNRPYLKQFSSYLLNILKGDFGKSYLLRLPVSTLVLKVRFPVTLTLAISSMLLAVSFGIPVGVLSAVKQYTVLDSITVIFALLMASIPAFWLALMLMLLFSLKLGWLPSSGLDGAVSFILPTITLACINSAQIIRMTRSSMLEVVRQDFIRTARAKGATEKRVIFQHALKNAIIPVLTVVGVNFGYALGGAVVTETVFALPGIGSLLVSAIRQKDNPVVLAAVILVAAAFSIVNLLVDLIYTKVDPRITL